MVDQNRISIRVDCHETRVARRSLAGFTRQKAGKPIGAGTGESVHRARASSRSGPGCDGSSSSRARSRHLHISADIPCEARSRASGDSLHRPRVLFEADGSPGAVPSPIRRTGRARGHPETHRASRLNPVSRSESRGHAPPWAEGAGAWRDLAPPRPRDRRRDHRIDGSSPYGRDCHERYAALGPLYNPGTSR